MKVLTLLALLLPLPALAGTSEVLDRIGAGYDTFAGAAADLAAVQSCEPAALQPAFDAAWDAWVAVGHFRAGPAEQEGRALAIAFWPDPKGSGPRTMAALLKSDAPLDPASFAEQSVAARGLTALERLLYDPAFQTGRACDLTRAITADLSRMAQGIVQEWPDFAALMETAGAAGNTRFLTPAEATQTVYTQIMTGLEFDADMRLLRPMGTPDRPRPERAEGRLSQRSLRNIQTSLAALEADAVALKPDIPQTLAAFADARRTAEATDFADRASQDVLRLKIRAIHHVAETEIGAALGINAGFNAADGD